MGGLTNLIISVVCSTFSSTDPNPSKVRFYFAFLPRISQCILYTLNFAPILFSEIQRFKFWRRNTKWCRIFGLSLCIYCTCTTHNHTRGISDIDRVVRVGALKTLRGEIYTSFLSQKFKSKNTNHLISVPSSGLLSHLGKR